MLTALKSSLNRLKILFTKPGNCWRSLPRKARTIILLAALIPVLLLLYTFMGNPAFSIKQQYRRLEKANLVGPAKILDILTLENYSYDRLVLADDGDGMIFYTWNTEEGMDNYFLTQFLYREKQGDVSVYAAPSSRFENWELSKEIHLPVFVFDEFPKAVRAKLDLTIDFPYSGHNLTRTYSLQATREKSGYFQFMIHAQNPSRLAEEGVALQTLSLLTGHDSEVLSATTTTIPATVRLYDADDQLIHESTVQIRSVEGAAHAKQNDLE